MNFTLRIAIDNDTFNDDTMETKIAAAMRSFAETLDKGRARWMINDADRNIIAEIEFKDGKEVQ